MRLVKDAHNDARLFSNGVTCAHETQIAMDAADKLHWDMTSRELEVTSAVDGKHSKHSRHYVGLAFDIRQWYLPRIDRFVSELQRQLGINYDVVREDTHIHCEYDPER